LEPATEKAVVQAVLAGDPEPFARIVRQYQNLVGSVAYRMGVPSHAIEDVASEVFMKVYKNLHQYDARYALSSWIYRIATNHVLDEYRKHGRTRPVPLDDIAEPGDPRVNVAGDSEATERDGLVRDAVLSLPDEYRRVLVLKHFEERSVDEIAGILGIPEGTVKIRLMRGRQRLGKLLSTQYPEHFGAGLAPAAQPRGL
jgi:RNA polymerase sigma-70 factor (ECF subfamily)